MNKIFKGVMLSMLALGFASCSDDSFDYTPAEAPTNAQVFFPNSNVSSYTLSDAAETIYIPIQRAKTDEALTVNLSLNAAQTASAFTIPASVSFAAGEATTNIPLDYDPSQMEYESADTVVISISDASVSTPYGISQYKFYTSYPSPLELLGKGTFIDNWLFEGAGTVEIYQNTQNPNEFRIMKPWEAVITGMGYNPAEELDGNQSPYITLTILQPGQTLGDVDITHEGLVYYPVINSGFFNTSNNYNQDILVCHPASFTSLQSEAAWAYNRVTAWQDNGLPGQIQLAPYFYMDGIGGWNYTTADDVIVINFPGFVPKDLSASLTYMGIFTNIGEEVFAVANVELGSDVTDARAIVVSEDVDPDAVADAIVAGDIEATPVTSGRIEVPIEEGLTGKLLLVLVVLDEGELKAVESAKFEYYGGEKSPWKSLGIGLFNDNFFITMYSPDGVSVYDPYELEVEIQESTEHAGLYRLVNPFQAYGFDGYVPSNLEINATDPEGVYFTAQETGIDDGDGMTYLVSYGGYMLNRYDFDTLKDYGYFGELKDGVITLPKFEYNQDGNQFTYQGLFLQGSSGWYTGTDGDFRVVLPEAVSAQARAKARANSKAVGFAKRMNLRPFVPAKAKLPKRIISQKVKDADQLKVVR